MFRRRGERAPRSVGWKFGRAGSGAKPMSDWLGTEADADQPKTSRTPQKGDFGLTNEMKVTVRGRKVVLAVNYSRISCKPLRRLKILTRESQAVNRTITLTLSPLARQADDRVCLLFHLQTRCSSLRKL